MNQFKIYREDNYITVVNTFSGELYHGFVKEVFVKKSNVGQPAYKLFNVKDFDEKTGLTIAQLLKEDGSAYTESEFETFYTQNTGNFNQGSNSPGVQSVTGTGVNNTDPQNPVITETLQGLQSVLDTGKDANITGETSYVHFLSGTANNREFYVQTDDGGVFDANKKQSFIYIENTFAELHNRGFNKRADISLQDGEFRVSQNNIATSSYTTLRFAPPIVSNANVLIPAPPINGTYTLSLRTDTATVQIITATTFTITSPPTNLMLTYTTAASNVTTLPDPTLNAGKIIFFTNKLLGIVTLNSFSEANTIWDGGVSTNTYPVPSGVTARLICDGVTYNVL